MAAVVDADPPDLEAAREPADHRCALDDVHGTARPAEPVGDREAGRAGAEDDGVRGRRHPRTGVGKATTSPWTSNATRSPSRNTRPGRSRARSWAGVGPSPTATVTIWS